MPDTCAIEFDLYKFWIYCCGYGHHIDLGDLFSDAGPFFNLVVICYETNKVGP